MNSTLAKTAGFCFGVNRAVDIVFAKAKEGNPVCTLGPIIHNRFIVKQLEDLGVSTINTVEENTQNATVIIRSHGVGRQVYAALDAMGYSYIDATCPYVAKIHSIVSAVDKGTTVLIAGDSAHPEIQGIIGHLRAPHYSFLNAQQLTQLLKTPDFLVNKPIILLSQTTFNQTQWKSCVEIAKKVCTNLAIFDTICNATIKRQQEAEMLAAQSDLMLIIGDRHSANTAKLVEVCKPHCPAILVESAEEINPAQFCGLKKVGITAGASTPAFIIKEVQEKMENIGIENTEQELSFEEMLDLSFKSTYNGEKVTAIVTGIAPNEISVDIGTKHAGYVPLHELTDDPNAKPEDLVKKGDEIELMVVRVNDVEGTVMLSKKRLDAVAGFEKVMNAAETQEILDGVVVEVVKGGLLVATNGVRVFVPASQSGLPRGADLAELMRKNVSFKILETDRQRRRAVGSVSAVMREQRKVLADKFWEDVTENKAYKGIVKSITNFGVFVDLGGVDGRISLSDLCWHRVKHPSEVVSVGDALEVTIKEIDNENKKISLIYKKSEDNPWEIMREKYNVGDVTKVKIMSVTGFGAFAQIIPGVDGLIHISQISNQRVEKAADELTVGQEVDAKITELDLDKKRVSLSIKALLAPLEDESTEGAAQ